MNSSDFYEQLPIFDSFEEVTEFGKYHPVPDDWYIVVADVVNSTGAIEEGKYKQVNVLGAAIITAVSKLFHPRPIPYIFAGDGIFICTPPGYNEKIKDILAHIRLLADRQFGLQQISGIIPVADVRNNEGEIRVGRFYISDHYSQAVFKGNGLSVAEQMVRADHAGGKYQVTPALHPGIDLSNLECRWNHLESMHEEIICVLVKVVESEDTEEIYRQIVRKINQIYCEDFVCKPVKENEVNLSFKWERLRVEYKIRTFGQSWLAKGWYLLKLYAMQLAGKFVIYFGLNADGADWSMYKKDLEQNTDYRKFDDMIREVLSGTERSRKMLTSYLESLYQQGKIAYGIHVTPTVMLTCMVMNYDKEHFHFVDGSAGGYAAAASDLKNRISMLQASDDT